MTNNNTLSQHEIKDSIRQLVEQHPRTWTRIALSKKEFEKYGKHILDYVPIPEIKELHFSTRTYWFLNDVTEFPKCATCGKELDHKQPCRPLTGYLNKHCSNSCAQKDPLYQQQQQKKSLEKYGTLSPTQSAIVKQKQKETLSSRSKEAIEKSNELRRQTCEQRYGKANVSQVKEIKDKSVAKFVSRSIDEKKKTREKTHKTIIERYGKDYYHTLIRTSCNVGQMKRSYKMLSQSTEFNIFCSEDEYVKMKFDHQQRLTVQCKKCKEIYTASIAALHRGNSCPICRPAECVSKTEQEMQQFIVDICKQKNMSYRLNTRQAIYPLELDVFVSTKNIAIEFDGLYWHSDDLKLDKDYHLNKTQLCEEKNIQLVHVFENEWLSKKSIVKSRIRNLLGVYDRTLYARKCVIKEVDSKTSKAFQEQNHIQGAVHASINIGLYCDNELVSVMTFGKTRFSKKYEWELLRFCSKLNYHVIGAAGKLLSYFEKTYRPKSLVSYADRRWSQGKVYKALGFELDHISAPNYWYWKDVSQIYSRVMFQKHTLSKQLKSYDPALTEVQNMKDNGYKRIFDCGNLVFTKILDPQSKQHIDKIL